MRTAQNPERENKPLPAVPAVSLCVVTHCVDHPYYAQKAEITRMSIQSMLAGMSDVDYELVIWDNGSTPEYRAMLRAFEPTVFIESVNVGPHMARRALVNIARGDIINLADDDILYAPDWFEKQYQVMTTYPNMCVVSGSPINIEFRRNWQPDHDFASRTAGVNVKFGDIIPIDWECDWCYSIGKNPKCHKKTQVDVLLEYRGVKAWAQAHHMQMLCSREKIAPFLKPVRFLIDFWDIANEISEAGYLQLTTYERTAIHIGNVIDPSIKKIAKEWQNNLKSL